MRVLVILLLGVAPAWAVLGEYESSVSVDQQFLKGEDRQQPRPGYKLHQITALNGVTVREYVSPDGKVFGVAWSGQFAPNMQQLLGSYFPDLDQAARSQVRRRGGPLVVRTDRLVLVSAGHLRSFRGHAYVPSLLPNNVSAEVVR
jgi:hypothetical protein